MFNVGEPDQSEFELEFNLNGSSLNNHPYLNWNSADYSVLCYKIFKKKDGGNWSSDPYANTANNFYEDTAETILLPGGIKSHANYKVRARINYDEIRSFFSNDVSIVIHEFEQIEKNSFDKDSLQSGNELPKGNFYCQSFPNPFNSFSFLKFYLPEQQLVDLKIYNITGQIVNILIDSKIMKEGEHSVIFNAKELPSGYYFYEINTERHRKIERILFLK